MAAMLEGLRVVEFSTDVAAAFAGRLLAAYGADVTVVEPPEGHALRRLPPWPNDRRDPQDSILFAYLGAGKRSVVLDLATPEGVGHARSLVEHADAVIESYAPGALAALGVDLAALAEVRPQLVVTSITPYGQSGPKAHWRATALTAYAAGGQMGACGDPDRPPLKTAGHQAYYQAGLHAFSATLTALVGARHSGVGDRLDISVQEVQVSTLEGALPNALVRTSETGRSGNATFAQWGIHPSKDGWIGLAAMPRQTYAVYDCIGHPELKEDPAFASGWRPDANTLLMTLVPEWTAQRTSEEIFEFADRYRAPFSMIPTPRQLLEWPHFRETGFWRWVEHPRLGRHPLPAGPIQFGRDDRGEHRRAPLIGEHTSEVLASLGEAVAPSSPAPDGALPLPLAGVRVIDMTQVWAGPYGTRLLGDMGAEVIKVEGPSFADPVRTMSGATTAPEINQSAYFNEYNRNKYGVTLDLKQPEGIEAVKRLIAQSDVFIENWSSGVAERNGLGYDDVRAIKPDIIYVSMPGFGHEGPDARRVGFGPTIEQMGGLVALQGYEGGPPHRSSISYGDPVAGTVAAGAVAIGLLHRERTGEGCYAVTPQRDAIVSLIGEYVLAEALGCPLPTRIGARDAYFAPHNVYRARDTEPRPQVGPLGNVLGTHSDRWLAIAIDSDEAWAALKPVVGDARLEDPAYASMDGRRERQDDIDAVIADWVAPLDADEAAARLQSAGVAAEAVLTVYYATVDPHLAARENWWTYDHPDFGVQKTVRSTWRLTRRPVVAVRHAPQFGGDSAEVLQRVAGYTEAEVADLEAKQVISTQLLGGG